MEECYQLTGQSSVVRLLQITDPHLLATNQDRLLGVNTTASFQAVIEAIGQTPFEFDAILATGDLVQDHHREAYHHFAQMIKPLAKPTFWVEGNHDIQPQMANALAIYAQIQPQKQILAGDYWQIILLDSHLNGVPRGQLSSAQLAFLQQALATYPDRYSLIVLHHNILPTGSAWLDQHSLANGSELASVLAPFPKVRALLHGHIHQEVDGIWQGYRILATPSTCIQFKPRCDQFTLDTIPQGWRELSLYSDGTIETCVRRLATNDFLPDFKSLGY